MPLIIFRYLSELSQKRSLFCLLLFQIFPEVSQSHVALFQEGIVHGEGCPHALWLMTLLGKLQIFAEHRALVWMSTVFDDFLGTAQRTLATKIGNALLGNNDIHIMLRTIHVATHRNDG